MKFLKQYCKSLTISIALIFSSASTFAENPLVTQAKELQTGSEKVGIDHQKAIALLKQASDEGDAEAMYQMALYYNSSNLYWYVPDNSKLYMEYLLKAANRGHHKAFDSFYYQMEGEFSFYGASKYYSQIARIFPRFINKARAGDAESMLLVGKYGLGGTTEVYQCEWLFKAFAKLKNKSSVTRYLQACDDEILEKLNAPSRLQLRELQANDELLTLKELKNNAESGKIKDLLAVNDFTVLYSEEASNILNDQYKNEIKNKILKFYTKQGQQGYSDAYIYLANEADGILKQMEWMKKAIPLNNAIAFRELGYYSLYPEKEKGQKENIQNGLNFLKLAVEKNDAIAMNYLAVWLDNDKNKAFDPQKAQLLYEKSAQLGDANAIKNLAYSSERDDEHKWAVEAFNTGSVDFEILTMAEKEYKDGISVKKDSEKINYIQKVLSILYETQTP